EYEIEHPLLDVDKPVTYGPLDLQDFYFEHKRQQSEAMKNALDVIPEVLKEFNKTFGKKHDLLEEYKLEDADIAIVALSSTAGTAKVVIDQLRKDGIKAGLLKPILFRPFPKERITKSLSNSKVVAVLDRAESFSTMGGPLFNDLRSALYDSKKKPLLVNYIYGLGGRDILPEHIKKIFMDLEDIKKTGKVKSFINYVSVRE
ncbi:unnamed protein product, partial [marine sediment metagenome]